MSRPQLKQEMQHLHDSWESVVQEAKVVAEAVGVQLQFPKYRKNFKEPKQEFRISVVYPVLAFIISDLKTRFEAADTISELLSPILNFQNLDDGHLTAKAAKFVNTHEKNLSEDLLHEILHLKSIHKTIFGTERRYIRLLNAIYNKKLKLYLPISSLPLNGLVQYRLLFLQLNDCSADWKIN